MTTWENKLRSHPVQRSLSELSTVADQLAVSPGSSGHDSIKRLVLACRRIHDMLRSTDPQWWSPRVLDRLDGAVRDVLAAAARWRTQRDTAALAALDGAVNELIDVPLGWPVAAADSGALDRLRADGEKAVRDFTEYLDDQRAVIDHAVRQASAASSEAGRAQLDRMEQMLAQADALREQIDRYRQQAAEVVGAVATAGLAGGFKQYADDQQRSADRWRIASISGAGLASVIAVGVFLIGRDQPFSWNYTIGKVLGLALVAAIAAYAGRESSSHRQREVAARRLQLELTAIDPYLASLDATRRDSVKEQIAQRIFGQPAPDSATEAGPVPLATPEAQQMLRDLINLAQSLIKK